MIRTLPLAPPELGRIRLGDQEPVLDKQTGQPVIDKKTGQPKMRPVKGETLRFSSNDDVVLRALASQHGGEVRPWPGGEQTWQLTTESNSIDVYLAPKAVETFYEQWGDAGCKRRCDGEDCTFLASGPEGAFLDTGTCRCLDEGKTPGDVKAGACSVTVRLWLVLPDVPGIGVWMCTSHSVYAAMELPGQVALMRQLMPESEPGRAPLIPATFAIEKRSVKKPYERFARDYIVPVLRVRRSLSQLMAPGNGDLEAGGQPALATARPALVAGDAAAEDELAPSGDHRPAPASSSSDEAVTARAIAAVRRRAAALGMDESRLNSFVKEATGNMRVDEIASHLEANAVLRLLSEHAMEERT